MSKDNVIAQCGERLKAKGYRLTPGRRIIFDVLFHFEGHLSAEDIFLKVRERHSEVSVASVYRTLDIFERAGLVYKFDFGHGRAKFEMAEDIKGEEHHHHLVCTICGEIIDYKDFSPEELDLLRRAEANLYSKYDFKIKTHLIQFYGTCAKCARLKTE